MCGWIIPLILKRYRKKIDFFFLKIWHSGEKWNLFLNRSFHTWSRVTFIYCVIHYTFILHWLQIHISDFVFEMLRCTIWWRSNIYADLLVIFRLITVSNNKLDIGSEKYVVAELVDWCVSLRYLLELILQGYSLSVGICHHWINLFVYAFLYLVRHQWDLLISLSPLVSSIFYNYT